MIALPGLHMSETTTPPSGEPTPETTTTPTTSSEPSATPTVSPTPSAPSSATVTTEPSGALSCDPSGSPCSVELSPDQFSTFVVGIALVLLFLAGSLAAQLRRP